MPARSTCVDESKTSGIDSRVSTHPLVVTGARAMLSFDPQEALVSPQALDLQAELVNELNCQGDGAQAASDMAEEGGLRACGHAATRACARYGRG
jgi:hypothetical protein